MSTRKPRLLCTSKINCYIRQGHNICETEVQHRRCQRIHHKAHTTSRCKPIFSRIVSLHAENNHLQFAIPGGLNGTGTKTDSTLCRTVLLVKC
ncbi:hypothetical protein EV424DRAFT_1400939 [Suillus variegatus]|nr:hypothetical protein EV424DRAFT_1400939 [Suillus variegatus]